MGWGLIIDSLEPDPSWSPLFNNPYKGLNIYTCNNGVGDKSLIPFNWTQVGHRYLIILIKD